MIYSRIISGPGDRVGKASVVRSEIRSRAKFNCALPLFCTLHANGIPRTDSLVQFDYARVLAINFLVFGFDFCPENLARWAFGQSVVSAKCSGEIEYFLPRYRSASFRTHFEKKRLRLRERSARFVIKIGIEGAKRINGPSRGHSRIALVALMVTLLLDDH